MRPMRWLLRRRFAAATFAPAATPAAILPKHPLHWELDLSGHAIAADVLHVADQQRVSRLSELLRRRLSTEPTT